MDEFRRLGHDEHTGQPWRIHLITNDFHLEDVWALPTPGGRDDFPRLVETMAALDPDTASSVLRALFALRWKLGDWFGLDDADTGLGTRVESLRHRVPPDLGCDAAIPADSHFRPVFATDREAAFEIANDTVHGVLHLGWVADHRGGYRGQLAVLVKPNGIRGRAYMSAIAPIRHLVVYPLMLRAIGEAWRGPVRRIRVPEWVPRTSTLARVDYTDAFSVPTEPGRRTAEQWARATLEPSRDTESRMRRGWTALGLHVDDDAGVAGWTVRRTGPDTVLLGADSRVGMPAELLFAVRGDQLVFATMVQHGSWATRALWAALLPTHVATVRRLLNGGARRQSEGGAPTGAGGVGTGAGATGATGTFGPGA